MVGYKARTVLMKTAWLNWAVSLVLVIWHIVDGRDPDGTLIALFLVLAMSGTLVASIRYGDGPTVGKLIDKMVDALIASRPPDETQAVALRLVETQENGSPLPAPRRSVL